MTFPTANIFVCTYAFKSLCPAIGHKLPHYLKIYHRMVSNGTSHCNIFRKESKGTHGHHHLFIYIYRQSSFISLSDKPSSQILYFVDCASPSMRVMKPTWCTTYLQFILSLYLYIFQLVSWQSTKTYMYHLLHIYIVTSWWWANGKPKTCRCILTE
jgi:hypothetical protein